MTAWMAFDPCHTPAVFTAGGETQVTGVWPHAPSPLALPTVKTAREYGFEGYAVTLARYGKRRMDAWRRSGGRRRNPTYDELAATRASRASTRKGVRAIER